MSGTAGSRLAKESPESPAATLRAVMSRASTKGSHFGASRNSLVGSWIEIAAFPPEVGRPPLTSLTTFHDDGTISVNDQGSVTLDPPSVFTAGVGVWTRLRSRTFAYTQHELISDLSSNLVGKLQVRGIYTLSPSGNEYTGDSYYQVFIFAAGEEPVAAGWVTNAGQRIPLELPPPLPK